MSYKLPRVSKFKHVFGSDLKRDQCYDNIRVSKSSRNSTFCVVNPKFLAIITESGGGGAFIVVPISNVGRVPADYPHVSGHNGPVLDIDWCPHDDNLIASGSEDCVARLWRIPEGGLTESLMKADKELRHHQKRVGLVLWHPTAKNVLLTAGSDNLIIIWNTSTCERKLVIDGYPKIQSACWNWNGSRLLTSSKDRFIRIFDPRTGKVEAEALGHEGSHGTRAIFLQNGHVFTTGFSKTSERQYSLRAPDRFSEPMVMQKIDESNSVLFPLYDAETNMIYLCGKGDSSILYYEVTSEPPFVHFINKYDTRHPQRSIGKMPKRGLDVSSCEIARFYRCNNTGFCQVIRMTVPRKSESFQEDLYPPTPSLKPALSAAEWFSGRNANPVLVSMNKLSAAHSSDEQIDDGANLIPDEPTVAVTDRIRIRTSDDVLPMSIAAHSNSSSDELVGELAEAVKRLGLRVLALENLLAACASLALSAQKKE